MSHQSDPQSSNFPTLFESALQEYAKQTSKPWAEHPLAKQLEQCNSLESISDVLQEQAQAFTRSRGGDSRIVKPLKSAISVLYALSTNTTLRKSISASFPHATPIFVAFAVLLGAAKDVGASHDTLANLLELTEQFVNRLKIYTEVTLEPAMVELIVKMMIQLLHVLGLVTKEIRRKPLFKIGKKLLGKNDIEVALQKLDQLTLIEGRTTTAQILKHTDGLVHDGKATRKLLQQMTSDMNKSKRDKLAEDIRSWLTPPDPWKNQNEISKLRHPGTAAWFLNGETFSNWKSSEQSHLLSIRGKPGAGKSVLCSAIIQDIDDMRKYRPAILTFFYCDFKEERKRDLRGLLSSLLVQLCQQSDSYNDPLSKLFSDNGKGSQHASDAALVGCLKDILKLPRQHPVYLVVDALDECPNPPAKLRPRQEVLHLLKELIGSKVPNLHICVTSRPEADIIGVLDSLPSQSISLQDEEGQGADINNYIKSVINNDAGMQKWKLRDKQHVIDVLIKNANGMFRWVDCQVDYLRDCPTRRIRKVLEEVPKTLDETYARVLREIKESHQEFAQMTFQFVAVASRPLRVKELGEVFAFDFEAGAIPEFREDWREDDPVYAVLSACSSLLAVVNVKGTQVIQFAHFSVKEFLTSDRFPQENDTISRYRVSMTSAHTLVARVCLGTLLHLPEDITSDSLRQFPLAEYAAEHWVDHAQFEDASRNVEDGMKELFDPRKPHLVVWVWIHDLEASWRGIDRGKIPSGLRGTALHYAALCGLGRIAEWLITEHAQDVQARGFGYYSTPMHGASYGGHVELARVLLKHGAVATVQDKNGSTPLHGASSGGHVELARVLLEHGAVATAPNENGRTPLHWASDGGHVELARVLLEHGAVATAQDEYGSTPLHGASKRGHVEFARVLLEHGAVATVHDGYGQIPLYLASEGGHLELARVLLKHGAVTTAQDSDGLTPLHRASSGGHLELARVLLKHGAVATAQSDNGYTPLLGASFGGHVELARVLLEHGAVATVQDKYGWTPLDRASEGGHLEFARVLLEHGAVTTAQNKFRYSPLHYASSGGHLELARVLLEHGAVATAQDEYGRTPLHPASEWGHVELARVLLEHGAVATAQDKNGSTPLHYASKGGYVELAGVFPLHKASEGGHLELARVLLEHGAVATAQNECGSTPLHRASDVGHLELARVLLKHGAVATAQDSHGWTPLHGASKRGHLELARVLLENGAVATAQDSHGSTALSLASSMGHVELAQVFLQHRSIVTAQDR